MNGEAAGVVVEWVLGIILTLGYAGVVLLVALDNVFPPIPSEAILPLAGVVSGQGHLWLPGVIAAATVGSVAGALPLYGLGFWLGEERLRRLIRERGRWVLLCEADLDKAQAWFDRHGPEAVLIGRLFPVARSLISVPAGLQHMALWKFSLYTVIGTALFDGALIGLGWWLGSQWEQVEQYASWFEYAALALMAGLVGRFIWKRVRGGGAVCEQQSDEDGDRAGTRPDDQRFERPRDQPEEQWADDVRVVGAGRDRR